MKRATDRLGILNPGKLFGIKTSLGFPVAGWRFKLASSYG
jgi:hypothetical protein